MKTRKIQVLGLKCDPALDGVGISSIEQTTSSDVDGGSNIITITLTNGESTDIVIKNGGGGTSALPEVTADDNGKVLMVVDGEWEITTIVNGNEVEY